MDNEKFATELLHELKATGKRWFIAFCIMVALEVATIAGFLWYISLPIEEITEEVEQEMSDTERSIMIGIGDNNGTAESEKNTPKKSN